MSLRFKGNANLTDLGNDSIRDEMRILLNWRYCALLCSFRNHWFTCGSVCARMLVGEYPSVTQRVPKRCAQTHSKTIGKTSEMDAWRLTPRLAPNGAYRA